MSESPGSFGDWPLRAKLALLLTTAAVTPLAVLTATNVIEARTQIFDSEAALLAARADQLVNDLDQFNFGYQRAASRLSHVPEVVQFIATSSAATTPEESQRAREAITRRLTIHVDHDPALRGIALTNRSGVVIAATETEVVGRERGFRAYAQQALAGRAVTSDPYVSDTESQEPTIAVAAPVSDASGRVIGMVAFWIRAEALWKVARQANGLAGPGSFATVYDQTGIRIAHTFDRGIVFRPAGTLDATTVQSLVAERRFGVSTATFLADVHPFPEQFERARAVEPDRELFKGFAPSLGSTVFVVARRFRSVSWTVFYAIPESSVMAPITALTSRRVAAAVLVALCALAAAGLLSSMFLRPVRRLTAATQRLAQGDLSARAAVDSGDELGELGAAFDAMAGRLEAQTRAMQRSHEELEVLVAQRTGELAASEAKYRDLYESAPDMYFTASLPDARAIDVNQTLCDRLGYTADELLGRPINDLYHPDSRPAAEANRQAFGAVGAVGAVTDVERRLLCKDGRSLDVSLTGAAVRDAHGVVVAARGVWRDISKRKQIERDRELLASLGPTLESSLDPEAVLEAVATQLATHLDVDRCAFVEIDEAADRAIIHRDHHRGLPSIASEQVLSRFSSVPRGGPHGVRTLVAADTRLHAGISAEQAAAYDAMAARALIDTALRREGRWVASLVVTTVGPRAWQEREIALVELVGERVWLWIEHLRVLGQLRESAVDAAVQRSEARFRTLVQGVADHAILMLDPQGVVMSWNPGATRLKGYVDEEIVGRSFEAFYTLADRGRGAPRALLAEATAAGHAESEGWRVRKDGTTFWANVVVTALLGPDGQLEGFAKVTRDFTERRRHDDALRRSLKEREVLLQEVHHRVKNNLQVISSLINMQARRLERGPTRSALEECQLRVLAIALVHEQLYQAADYAEVDLSSYARTLAHNVFRALDVPTTHVDLDLAIDRIPLAIDRAIPCGLVINELITNALKHAFKGRSGGKLRVELSRADEDRLRLRVTDDGPGLPDGFDLAQSRSMGMQLVRTLSSQLGAAVIVSQGRGASFEMTFAGRA